MNKHRGPLLSLPIHAALLAARDAGVQTIDCTLDLGRTLSRVDIDAEVWRCNGRAFAYAKNCKDRTIYYWDGEGFAPVARFTHSLVKLVPTEWGAPTFEIDGIKMLPTAQVSPYEDAQRKVGLIQPRGKIVLDTCGGLGYFADWCLRGDAQRVISFEKSPDVIWLRTLNPWSPDHTAKDSALTLSNGDVAEQIRTLADTSVDAILHDPPRFGIAGELYSQAFYNQLARVLKPRGRMFHYTGSPNKLTSRRDVPNEVSTRLQKAGFSTELSGDGVLAIRNSGSAGSGMRR
ncbi:class I SAM-dependent methyltransferase [Solimonas terrae]|uniref:SAM-dependent methyltransferase n=1 Tax=Solimonas terrae TaxID=1396819 RepID=A0A6M2BVT9_9GAMM|nr:MnmC family methyltransferase [Solimonas terrae]NGY06375.1 SAM-dependent methyltransferase [Solimonas terrae]